MMLPLLFAVAVLSGDSTYATPALRTLIDRAAERNRTAPAALRAYRAHVESEIAVMSHRADGRETAVSIEQSLGEVRWARDGSFEQHLTAYRSRQSGPTLSSLAFLRHAWAIPMLYGDRLALFFGTDSSTPALRDGTVPVDSQPGILAVHPFGALRDDVYRFGGGDTIAVMRTPQRTIPLVRILVEPRAVQPRWPVVVFRGEIDIDATRGEIVRMRGAFQTLGRRGAVKQHVLVVPVETVAFVELESREVDGQFWLPSYQRIEAQVAVAGSGETRTAFRVVSHFAEVHVTATEDNGEVALLQDSGAQPDFGPPPRLGSDSLAVRPHRLTLAPADSLDLGTAWRLPLGEATETVHADDFLDLAPDEWRVTGRPRAGLVMRRAADVLRFNRVSGVTTGLAGEVRMRDALPGTVLHADAQWAWNEGTLRGGVGARRERGTWLLQSRVGRSLDVTNDFAAPRDSGGGLLEAVFGVDDYDYVDRSAATLSLTHAVGDDDALAITLGAGLGNDRGEVTRVSRGLVGLDGNYRPNRFVDEGGYGKASLVLDWHPAVNLDVMRQGLGVRLAWTGAAGGLRWQRIEARLNARAQLGRLGFALRADAGALLGGDPPTQQLFELGVREGLLGYEYKAFAGDRAALVRALATWQLPFWHSPLRLFGAPWLPAAAPALAISLQSGATAVSSAGAAAAVERLGVAGTGTTATPFSIPSDGFRSSLEVGLRFFGGGIGIGMARPLEPGTTWRGAVTLGRAF